MPYRCTGHGGVSSRDGTDFVGEIKDTVQRPCRRLYDDAVREALVVL